MEDAAAQILFGVKARGVGATGRVFEVGNMDGAERIWLVLTSDSKVSEEVLEKLRLVLDGDASLLERLEVGLELLEDQSVALVGLWENSLYVMARKVQVYLVRNDLIVSLINGSNEVKESVSGWIHGGDELWILCGWSAPEGQLSRDQFYGHVRTSVEGVGVAGGWLRFKGSTQEMIVDEQSVVIPQAQPDTVATTPVAAIESAQPHSVVRVEGQMLPVAPTATMREQIVDWLAAIVNLLPRDDRIYVLQDRLASPGAVRGRRAVVFTALVLIVVFAGTVVWGIKQREQRVFDVQFGSLINEARYKLSESINLAELNPLRSTDLLGEVDSLLAELEKRGLDNEQLTYLRSQLQQARGLTMKKFETEPTVWLSLNLVRENISARDGAVSGSSLGVLDAVESRVVVVDVDSKAPEVVAGQNEVGNAQLLAVSKDAVVVLSDRGVVDVSGSTPKVILGTTQLGNVADLEVYGSFAYGLSNTGIWKVPLGSSENASQSAVPEQWLEEGGLGIWSGGKSLAIDGFVWVAQGQEIQKWTRGLKDVFEVKNLPDPWGQIGDIYTTEELPLLYVLDTGANRVVVIDKETGEYRSQYRWAQLNSVVDIGVNSDGTKMWWLTTDKIYEVELR